MQQTTYTVQQISEGCAKAMGKKVTDPERDLGTEYNVENAKERLD